MMKHLLISGLCFLFFSLNGFALTIEDFGWTLEDLDRQYSHLTFEEALKCGDKAVFQSAKYMCKETCQNQGGFSMCQTECVDATISSEFVTQEVVNCTADEVTIFSSDGDIRKITRQDFLRYKKNPLRELLHQIHFYRDRVAKIVVTSSYPKEHTLNWKTPQERKVRAQFIRATFEGQNPNEFAQALLTVINDSTIPWFAQAARIRIEREGTYWRLHEVK